MITHSINRLLAVVLFLLVTTQAVQAAQVKQFRIQSEKLKNTLSNYTILDVREPSIYRKGHIEGALNLPASWTFQHKKVNGKIITPNRIQVILRNLGIEKNTPVVVYDDGNLVDSARVFWTLEVYDLNDVKILNAGYDSWSKQKFPTSTQTTKPATSHYIPSVNHNRLATKFTTQIASKNPNKIIIDARDASAYQGLKSSAERFGHIPSAINLPASHNFQSINETFSLQPIEKLKKLYKHIPKNKKVVVYCALGRVSATNYFVLRELGFDVSNYDSSWKEWGNDRQLPITQLHKNK